MPEAGPNDRQFPVRRHLRRPGAAVADEQGAWSSRTSWPDCLAAQMIQPLPEGLLAGVSQVMGTVLANRQDPGAWRIPPASMVDGRDGRWSPLQRSDQGPWIKPRP